VGSRRPASAGPTGRAGLTALAVGAAIAWPAPHASAAPALGATAQNDRPNVVVIVTDDQRWDELDGMPIVRGELMAKGITFTNGFVVNPLCCPSRASILTGEWSHTTGVYRQVPPFGRFEALRDGSTIATWVDAAGYDTALVGKYIDGYQHAALTGYVPPGWDRWVAFAHSSYGDYALTVDGRIERPNEYATDVLARYAVDFVRTANGPLFLYFAPPAPHAPATPAPEFAGGAVPAPPAPPPSLDEADVSDKPAYVRALPRLGAPGTAAAAAFRDEQERTLLSVDRAVGEILRALDDTGRLHNTLIVFVSDNGLLLGEHRWTKKEVPYDEAIRIPFVVRFDAAGGPQGIEDDRFALNVDIAPTIAAAAGVPAPGAEGSSLLPLVEGEHPSWRTDFLVEHVRGANPVPTYCAVRSETSLYVRYQTDEEEFYDLAADPFELTNLAGDPADVAALEAARKRLAELCVPPPPGLYGGGGLGIGWSAVLGVALVLVAEAARRRRAGQPSPSVR
jgi:arylsulfatase A-like enzyme